MSTTTTAGFELRGEKAKIGVLVRDIWRSRGLMRILARKDFLVRYRRASLGLLWVVGLPIVQATMVGFIFSRAFRGALGPNYAVVVLSGMIPWSFFNGVISGATGVIVDGSDLATKIYFPRAVLPIVTAWAGFRGFIPAVGIVVLGSAILGAPLGVHLLLLAPAMVLSLALATGFGLLFAALYVYFRDMRFIVQAATMPWFWATGVIFPLSKLGSLRRWFEINPAVGMIELYRTAVGVASPGWERSALITVIWVIVLFALATPLYQRYDRVFVDLL